MNTDNFHTPCEVHTTVRPGPLSRPAFHLLRWCTAIGWLAWLLSISILWGEHWAGVLHPYSFLFAFLLAVTLLAALTGTASVLRRMVCGPRRREAAAWGLACFLPLGLWVILTAYTLSLADTGQSFPKNAIADVAGMAVASLLEGQARLAYPHRLESRRFVMFYDDRVSEPYKDLQAMDQHVAALEALTGKPLRAKIYWVRGELLGRRHFAIRGIVLGSSQSPANWDTADHAFGLSVDRHELTHGVTYQLQPPDADPPTLLIEGWAEAHSGLVPQKQAELALHSRSLWSGGINPTASYLSELTGESWYRRVDGPVYSVGAPFAAFVLRNYGVERFLRLYFACRPGRFAETCVAELSVELSILESQFWSDMERLALDEGTGN